MVEEHGHDVEPDATVLPWGSLNILQLADPLQSTVTEPETDEPTCMLPPGRDQDTGHPWAVVVVDVVLVAEVVVEVVEMLLVEEVVSVSLVVLDEVAVVLDAVVVVEEDEDVVSAVELDSVEVVVAELVDSDETTDDVDWTVVVVELEVDVVEVVEAEADEVDVELEVVEEAEVVEDIVEVEVEVLLVVDAALVPSCVVVWTGGGEELDEALEVKERELVEETAPDVVEVVVVAAVFRWPELPWPKPLEA